MNARLPVDVHFVVRHADKWRPWIDRADATSDVGVDSLHEHIVSNEDCWIVSTYLQLRSRVDNVRLVAKPPAGAMCVVSGLDFGIRDFTLGSFFIGARSDGPDPVLCQLRVVQNPSQEHSGEGVCIPHWPQPALMPRDPARGSRIDNMVFYGSENNLDPRFRTPAFEASLQRLGVTFRLHGRDGRETVAWNDYREADLVLAARNLTVADALTKPASKLVNAWLAGVPALLGPEPAFRDLRRSPLDFFEVRTADDALHAVAHLKAEPALYLAAVRNGMSRAIDHTPERIATRWIEFLTGPAVASYERWQRTGRWRRRATWFLKAPSHKRARQRAAWLRDHGARILDQPLPRAQALQRP